jgi:hypothetical protein
MEFNSSLKNRSDKPLKGITKVYCKNLCNILSLLNNTSMFFNTSQFISLLHQAEDLLGKLKKSDVNGNFSGLENEFNSYKEQFMKWQASLTG